ncbi:hypothetical protein CCHR01_02348 [Colletotrichum chrysophilum]|nr:hypothetical protein K456DRAFT_221296 [Colletotrichum gloeosporioides 23]KAK1855063.1 hypothetical protein CCHR01_02348 [Colletotrichum chrysophilum]
MGLCVLSAVIGISYVAIRNEIQSKNAADQAQAAAIVPRFPVMNFHAGSYNGTHYSLNHTLTAVSTGISIDVLTSTAVHCPEETETTTQPANLTSVESTTTIKKTRTQTRTHEQSQGTTVSPALGVTGTQSATQ